MKSILLATGATVVVAGTVTLPLRASGRTSGAAGVTKEFLGFLPILVAAWAITPDDLGFLPPGLLAAPRWFDLAACLFFYTAAFGGGLLQLYNLADRGLSLRILADLAAARGRSMTLDEIAACYGEGRGLPWMYGKRLDGLLQHRFIVVEGGDVGLTARGRFCGRWLAGLRRFLRLPSP